MWRRSDEDQRRVHLLAFSGSLAAPERRLQKSNRLFDVAEAGQGERGESSLRVRSAVPCF